MSTHTLPIHDYRISLQTWGKWTSVPPTIESPLTPEYLKTNSGLAAVADLFPKRRGYTYQCALALVNQQGEVYVNFMSLKTELVYNNGNPPVVIEEIENVPVWKGWTKVPDGGFQSADLALSAVALGEKLYLYAVAAATQEVYYNSTSDGQTWNGWVKVSPAKQTKIAVCAAPDGSLYLVDLDGRVWVNPNPTASGAWALVPSNVTAAVLGAPGVPFSTDAGVCVCAGNSRSDPSASALLCKPLGQQDVYYLSPQAQAWSGLPPSGFGSTNDGRTNVAIACAPIKGAIAASTGSSFLFLTGRHNQIYYGLTPFVPDVGSDSLYVSSPYFNWQQLDGFKTDAALAAAVLTHIQWGVPDGPGQLLVLFAKGADWGDVKMNTALFAIEPPQGGPSLPVSDPLDMGGRD